MYQIAILGTENSHAIHFAKLIAGGHPQRRGLPVADFHVAGCYGYDEKANQQMVTEGGVPLIMQRPDELLGKVDGIMVTARHGDNHLKYAENYLRAGIPAFIDKPVTIREEEAVALAKIAKENHAPLCGGSCCGFVSDTGVMKAYASHEKDAGKLLGGSVAAPINLNNEYGGFFFYSQHLVQILCEIFGYDPKSVFAVRRDNAVTALFRYDHFDVSAHYTSSYVYSAAVYGADGTRFREIDINEDGYAQEINTFCDMVRSGRMMQSYSEFIRPVFLLNALKQSMDSGCECAIHSVEI